MISIDDFLPKTIADTAAFLFLLFGVGTTFVFETCVVLPTLFGSLSSPWTIVHCIIGCYHIHCIIGNLYFLIVTDSTIKNVLMPTTLLPEWRFCAVCESNTPPRSSHCKTCDVCVLKRSHHCLFAGRCIGYKNCRYFLALLSSLCVGALHAIILNQFFIWNLLNGFSFKTFFYHMFPVVFLAIGSIPFKTAVFCFISVLDVAGFLFAAGLLLYHLHLAIRNRTTFEKSKGIVKYDLRNWKINLCESIGFNWSLVWLSPLIPSRLPRDGILFPTYDHYMKEAMKHK